MPTINMLSSADSVKGQGVGSAYLEQVSLVSEGLKDKYEVLINSKKKCDIQHFHYIHLYPQGNTHFHQYAVPEYKSLLTPKGKDCFNALTYEKLFEMMSQYFSSEKQKEWINYLYQRYMVK